LAIDPEAGSSHLGDAIGRVTSILCIPYGYTVTLWCSGALAVARLGRPGPVEVVLFAMGAVAAFVGLGLVGWRHLGAEVPMRAPSLVVINVLPVVVVSAMAILPSGRLSPWLGFLSSGALSTGGYVLGLAAVIRISRASVKRTGAR